MSKEIRKITIGGMLEETARMFPNQQAVKYIEMEFDKTYAQFNAEVDAVAKGLLAIGLAKGDHAAVWATNYPQWLVLLFATAKIGVVLVTVNTNYKEQELQYLLKQSDSKAIFVCDGLKDIDCEKTLLSICPEIRDCERGQLKSERLPELRIIVSFDNIYHGFYNWQELAPLGRRITDAEYETVKASLDPDDVVNMQYTSGTTGFPKGVMLTHINLVNNGLAIGDCMRLSDRDRLCIPVPFFHCFGLVLAVMACVTHGSTMIPLLWYTPMKVMHTIEFEKCTAVHGVPTMFIGMLSHRDFGKYNYSTLRTGIMAGAPCPVKTMQDIIDKMNLTEITIVYGQTESAPGCTQTTVEDNIERKVNTVGKTLPFMETKIVNPETNETLPSGVSGEFCVRGYNVMKGYYKNPEATAAAIDADGWLHTGDLASVDEHGYYKITGRIKDMIIRGGENIFPKEIEDFLFTHPAVQDVAVVGVTSLKYGEEACAFIIRREGQKISAADIQTYVSDHLAKYKSPRYVLFTDAFPLTASGKIQKYKLRKQALDALVEESDIVAKE